MVTVEKVLNGFNEYVIDEILPSLEGLKKLGVGIAVCAKARNMVVSQGILKSLGYQTADNLVDVDTLYEDAKMVAGKCGLIMQNIPSCGDITFTMSDIDNIYRRIK